MSALLPKADMLGTEIDVREVPKADLAGTSWVPLLWDLAPQRLDQCGERPVVRRDLE